MTEGPHELDVVRLNVELQGWPAGTKGTLVHAYENGGVVEVDDDEGRTLDFVTVAYADVTVLWSARSGREVTA